MTPNRPGTSRLRAAFGLAWLADLIATVFLFVVPYAHELNPVTVLLYEALGLAGVVLAAAAYAAVVVAVGGLLRTPHDGLFVAGAASLYALFATNNVVLLAVREPLPQALALLA